MITIIKVFWYVCLFLLYGFLGWNEVPAYVMVLLSSLIMIGTLIVIYYPIYFSRNIDQIERYLQKRENNATLYFIYAVTNNLDSDIDKAYAKILSKSMEASKKAVFHTIYGLSKSDLEMAKEYVGSIKNLSLREYYQALIYLEENNLDGAKAICKNIQSTGLKKIIEAEVLFKEDQQVESKKRFTSLLSKSKGIQYYTLFKRFNELFANESVKDKPKTG